VLVSDKLSFILNCNESIKITLDDARCNLRTYSFTDKHTIWKIHCLKMDGLEHIRINV